MATGQTRVDEMLRARDPRALHQLIPVVYEELKRIARHQRGANEATLSTTELVHEAFLKLSGGTADWEGRAHFFGAASQAMRQVLVDFARRPETTTTRATQLINLGMLLEYRGDVSRSEQLHLEALAIREALLGPRHPHIAAVKQNLAEILRRQGKLDESEKMARDAIAIARAAYPNGHPDLAEVTTSLARTLQAMKRWDEALVLYKEVQRLDRRIHGPDHIFTSVADESIADVYRAQQRFDLAEPYLRDAERVFRNKLGDRSLMTARARVKLGDVLRARGKLADAEPLLLAGLSAFQTRRMPHGSENMKSLALGSLVKLYEAQGRESEASRYRALIAADSQPRPR